MVKTKKHEVYLLVYKLVTLVLILLVATATIERVFSAMNVVKTPMLNQMGDQWMNENYIVYNKKDIFDTFDNETIMQYFQLMKTCKGQL